MSVTVFARDESFSVNNANDLIQSLEQTCNTSKNFDEYTDLISLLKSQHKKGIFLYELNVINQGIFFNKKQNLKCKEALYNTRISILESAQKYFKDDVTLGEIEFDLFINKILKKLYDEKNQLNKGFQTQLNHHQKAFLVAFTKDPLNTQKMLLKMLPLIKHISFQLDYSDERNEEIREAHKQIKSIYLKVYDDPIYMKLDSEVQLATEYILESLHYHDQQMAFIKALKSKDTSQIKKDILNFEKFYLNDEVERTFYKVAKFDYAEVVPQHDVSSLVMLGYFQLKDLKQTIKWYENSPYKYEITDDICLNNKVVEDESLNNFFKLERVWFEQEKELKQSKCTKEQKNSIPLNKLNYDEMILNYQNQCQQKDDYVNMLVSLRDSDLEIGKIEYQLDNFLLIDEVIRVTHIALYSTSDSTHLSSCLEILNMNKKMFLDHYLKNTDPKLKTHQQAKEALNNKF